MSRRKPTNKVCQKCERSLRSETNFYKVNQKFYPDGRFHLCKDCMWELVDGESLDYEEAHDNFIQILRMLDKPLYQEHYNGDMRAYITMMQSLPQYSKKTFLDSDTFKDVFRMDSNRTILPVELTQEQLEESQKYWGVGFEEVEYIWLNAEMGEYLKLDPNASKAMEDLLAEICLTRLEIRKMREANQSVDKALDTLNKLMKAAKISPSDEEEYGSNAEHSLGMLVKHWEENDPIPSDYDWGSKDETAYMLKIFFAEHLARVMGKTEMSEEYIDAMNTYGANISELRGGSSNEEE